MAKLCIYLRDLKVSDIDTSIEFDPYGDVSKAALPDSYFRAVEMLDSLRYFGFVSFFK